MVDKMENTSGKIDKERKLITFIIRFFIFLLITTTYWLIFSKLYIDFKVNIIRYALKLIYKSNAPFIHEIPFYQGLSTPIITFISLILATINKNNLKLILLNKNKLIFISLSILSLFLLELLGHLIEIIITKTNTYQMLPYFLITMIFSIGIVVIPIFLWFKIFDINKNY